MNFESCAMAFLAMLQGGSPLGIPSGDAHDKINFVRGT